MNNTRFKITCEDVNLETEFFCLPYTVRRATIEDTWDGQKTTVDSPSKLHAGWEESLDAEIQRLIAAKEKKPTRIECVAEKLLLAANPGGRWDLLLPEYRNMWVNIAKAAVSCRAEESSQTVAAEPGYRLLDTGEIVEPGDEYWDGTQWCIVASFGHPVGCLSVRRRVEVDNLLATTDAEVWAREFVRLHGGDEDLMLAWFANAFCAGEDAAKGCDIQPGTLSQPGTFEWALSRLKAGAAVKRGIWPVDICLTLRPGAAPEERPYCEVVTGCVYREPQIDIHYDGGYGPWNPHQDDMLATDWEEIQN